MVGLSFPVWKWSGRYGRPGAPAHIEVVRHVLRGGDHATLADDGPFTHGPRALCEKVHVIRGGRVSSFDAHHLVDHSVQRDRRSPVGQAFDDSKLGPRQYGEKIFEHGVFEQSELTNGPVSETGCKRTHLEHGSSLPFCARVHRHTSFEISSAEHTLLLLGCKKKPARMRVGWVGEHSGNPAHYRWRLVLRTIARMRFLVVFPERIRSFPRLFFGKRSGPVSRCIDTYRASA